MDDGLVTVPRKRSRGRPPKDSSVGAINQRVEGVFSVSETGAAHRAGNEAPSDDADLRSDSVRQGVTVTWLANILRMDAANVRRRLAPVTPMVAAGSRGSQSIYDVKTAMPHLVDPIFDAEELLRKMDPKDLPVQLTTDFWRAEKTRLQTLEMAKDLWSTATVVEGYAAIFKILRDDTGLWLDTLDEVKELDDAQRRAISQLVEGLLANIRQSLMEHTEANATRSELQYLETRLIAVKPNEIPKGDADVESLI